jgi:hypothetical protein
LCHHCDGQQTQLGKEHMHTGLASSTTRVRSSTQQSEEADFMRDFMSLSPSERVSLVKTMAENLAAKNTRQVANTC